MIGGLFFFPLGPASIEGSPARGIAKNWASFVRFYTPPPRLDEKVGFKRPTKRYRKEFYFVRAVRYSVVPHSGLPL